MIFLRKLLRKSLSIYNTVEKIVAVVKKVVVCVVDNFFFAVSVVVCEVEVCQVLFRVLFYILRPYLPIGTQHTIEITTVRVVIWDHVTKLCSKISDLNLQRATKP